MIEHYPVLGTARSFMDDFYAIFADKPRPSEAEWRRQVIVSKVPYKTCPIRTSALAILGDKAKFEKVTLFLSYQNLNSTSNDVERDNRAFRKRQKTHYRLRAKVSLETLLHLQLVRDGPPTGVVRLKRRFGNPNWTKRWAG